MSTLFTGISELHTVSEAGTLDDAAIVVTDGGVVDLDDGRAG